ncbi:unnamed protein product [Arabis nemorensis]|uniref:Uncharacterized protein n=1 Tax=Arabis nemorensis TaxID=586526 RepID=A0A565CD36_9BRAS|nr:unnamed protein product [Arabis nemorensis]
MNFSVAKLMTGGMVPFAVTLATDDVVDSFSGDSKGHSNSAHATGCATAAKAIEWFKDPEPNHRSRRNLKRGTKTWRHALPIKIACIEVDASPHACMAHDQICCNQCKPPYHVSVEHETQNSLSFVVTKRSKTPLNRNQVFDGCVI